MLAKYMQHIKGGMERHGEFLAALRKYIKLHNEAPDKCRLHCRTDLEVKETVSQTNKEGVRQVDQYEFVELWAWKAENPGREPPGKVITQNLKGVGPVEGFMLKLGKAGHHKFEDFAENTAEKTLILDSGDGPMLSEQQSDRKFDAAATAVSQKPAFKEAVSLDAMLAAANAAENIVAEAKSSDASSSDESDTDINQWCSKLARNQMPAPSGKSSVVAGKSAKPKPVAKSGGGGSSAMGACKLGRRMSRPTTEATSDKNSGLTEDVAAKFSGNA